LTYKVVQLKKLYKIGITTSKGTKEISFKNQVLFGKHRTTLLHVFSRCHVKLNHNQTNKFLKKWKFVSENSDE
jgi:hypothetical protein